MYNSAMRYMGIDYGSKRIGIAVSDENNTFALPHSVILNSKKELEVLEQINTIICDKEITHIIIGESKDFSGKENPIMKDIKIFKEALENRFAVPVIYEPEFLTSHHAEKFQGKNDMHDASAAALILQSYLDRDGKYPLSS